MKKKKYGKYLLYGLAAFSFLIAAWEGFIYYSDYSQTRFLQLLLVLENSIKAFLFSPELSAEDVVSSLQETTDTLEYLVGFAYTAAVFIAPLCTATAAYHTLERLLRKGVRASDKEKNISVVFGWNDTVESMLTADTKKEAPIYLFTDTPLSDEQQLTLLRHNVTLCHGADPKRSLRIWKRANRFFLLDASSSRNFSTYITLRRWWESAPRQPGSVPRVICACGEPGIRELFAKFHDKNNQDTSLPVSLFSFPDLKARSLWAEYPICSYNFDPNSKISADSRYDVHMLIAGLGQLGSQVLEQAVSLGVLSSSGALTFDVIDKRGKELMRFFAARFASDYIESDYENAQLTIPSRHADGMLTIRFHTIDVDGGDLRPLLNELNRQNPFTYAAICLKNPDSAIRCTDQLSQVLLEAGQNIPVAVRMEFSQKVADFLREESPFYGRVFPICGGLTSITLDTLSDKDAYAGAVQFNYEYEKWSAQLGGYENSLSTPEAAWNTKDYFQQDSSLFQYLHQAVKKMRFEYDRAVPVESNEVSSHEMALLGSPPLSGAQALEFARLEHRRWCYYMAIHGWGMGEKNKVQKRNPCMVPWFELCSNESTSKTCPYDTTPYRILLQTESSACTSRGTCVS